MAELLLISISFVFLLLSIYFFFKSEKYMEYRIIFSLLVLFSVVMYILYLISDYFTGAGISKAVMLQLSFGLVGSGFAAYIKVMALSIGALTVALLVCVRILFRKIHHKKLSLIMHYSPIFLILISIALSPGVHDLFNRYTEDAETSNTDSTFYDYYKSPTITEISNQSIHKNFIFIYAESLEHTYFNQSIFPNLTHNLMDLESKGISFTDINTIIGTEITIAGQVGSLCGIPLVAPSHFNSLSGIDQFLPSAVCLGDLLNQSGYDLTFYKGANEKFSGTNKFFSQHGFTNVSGYYSLSHYQDNLSYHNGWGLYDDTLFDIAFDKFITFSESNKTFGMVVETVDTHNPRGFISKACENMTRYVPIENGPSILNAVSCSDYVISKFIHKVMDSPYYNNTVIILISDHIALKNTATDLLMIGPRKDTFMIFDSGIKNGTKISKLGFKYDVGATILPFLGYKGDIALGRNLLSPDYNLTEIRRINSSISGWRENLMSFWDFPTLKMGVVIKKDFPFVKTSTHTFIYPIIINYDTDLNSKIYFDMGSFGYRLADIIGNNHFSGGLIWVDNCTTIGIVLSDNQTYPGYCMAINDNGKMVIKPIEDNQYYISGRDLKKYININDKE